MNNSIKHIKFTPPRFSEEEYLSFNDIRDRVANRMMYMSEEDREDLIKTIKMLSVLNSDETKEQLTEQRYNRAVVCTYANIVKCLLNEKN